MGTVVSRDKEWLVTNTQSNSSFAMTLKCPRYIQRSMVIYITSIKKSQKLVSNFRFLQISRALQLKGNSLYTGDCVEFGIKGKKKKKREANIVE